MNKTVGTIVLVTMIVLTLLLSGCLPQTTPTPTPTVALSQYQLGYRLLAAYPDFFWCDPDFYPVARPGSELGNAVAQFPTIRANAAEFSAILAQLNLPDKADYSDAEKLLIYQEHKRLTLAIQMTASGNTYGFTLRTGKNQGFSITGTITSTGVIKEMKKETSFNTCPICLTKGTVIATPDGNIRVEQIAKGMTVWTADASGNRVTAEVIDTISTPVPPSFQVVKVILSDGRTVSASPGHPTADWRALGDYQVGDALDGSTVVSTERVTYDAGATYDILPAGVTGEYWANGVLLKSTLGP